MSPIYRIRNWEKIYENSRTLALVDLKWVRVPVKLDGDGYTSIMDRKDGVSIYGAWMALVQVASKCRTRGELVRSNGEPHTSGSLSRLTRIPEKAIADMLEFCEKHIKWLTISDPVSPGHELPESGHELQDCSPKRRGEESREEESRKEKEKPVKMMVCDNVRLLQDEIDKLVEKFGQQFYERCLEKLDNYKGSKGKTYKSDYRAILLWVVDAVKGDLGRGGNGANRQSATKERGAAASAGDGKYDGVGTSV